MVAACATICVMDEFPVQSKPRKLQLILSGFRVGGASVTVFVALNRHKNLVTAVRKLADFDKKLANFNIQPSYQKPKTIAFLLASACASSCVINQITSYHHHKKSIVRIICSLLCDTYQIAIVITTIVYLNVFCYAISSKLKLVVELVKSVEKMRVEQPLETLLVAAKMYEDLYQATCQINSVVSVPVLFALINGILEGMLTMNLAYRAEATAEDYVRSVPYVLQLVAILAPPMFFRGKPKQITRILGECDVCYRDGALSKAKNTFLFQTLQQDIKMTVCGLYPMSMSALSEQVGLCISLVLFVNQLLSI